MQLSSKPRSRTPRQNKHCSTLRFNFHYYLLNAQAVLQLSFSDQIYSGVQGPLVLASEDDVGSIEPRHPGHFVINVTPAGTKRSGVLRRKKQTWEAWFLMWGCCVRRREKRAHVTFFMTVISSGGGKCVILLEADKQIICGMKLGGVLGMCSEAQSFLEEAGPSLVHCSAVSAVL